MKRSEVAALLTMMAAYDRRTIGEADVIAWHAALDGHVLPGIAREAIIRHYRRSSDWLDPARLLAEAKVIRKERLDVAGAPDFPPGLSRADEVVWRSVWTAAVLNQADDPVGDADRSMGIRRAALLTRDHPQAVAARAAADRDIRTKRSEALRGINQEAQA